MSPLTDCARYWMSARTLLSSIQFLCSLCQFLAWFDEELSPLCTAPLARHLDTSLWRAGRDPDWALMGDNLWQGPVPTTTWQIRGCLCDWNSTEGSMAMCRLVFLGLALAGAYLVCVVWTCSPPMKYLLVEDILCPSGSLGSSAGVKGVSWHLEWPVPARQRAAVFNRPPQGLPLGQPAASLKVIKESWANCRWFVGQLWWSNMREMEGKKEESMHLQTVHVIYLITACLLIFVVWVFFFFSLKQLWKS